MKVSIEWLNELISLEGITAEELADKMSRTGIEVDGLENLGSVLKKVVVGHTLEVVDHPDSDHLHICQVDVGEEEPYQIVCGAPNIASDQKVIVALPNSRIKDNVKIKKGKLRGQVSQGMICSLEEIGFDENVVAKEFANGIAVLPEDAPVGTSIVDYLKLDDPILDLDVTPNRADALSVRGNAWEVAAIYGRQPEFPSEDVDAFAKQSDLAEHVSIQVDDSDMVPEYNAFLVRNVKIQPSPLAVQVRLMKSGIRPINNIVDATNYVLLEYGQPLHAFDYDKLGTGKIETRMAQAGEALQTLDGEERQLTEEDIVITDGQKPIALAGVMGGYDTEIDESTQNVLLEAAMFEPIHIRKTARRLGLRSESSMRNERGVNQATIAEAGYYAAQLMVAWSSGDLEPGFAQVSTLDHGDVKVPSSLAYINRVLGTSLTYQDIEQVFADLQFGLEGDADHFTVTVPPRRWDIHIPADLTEEVARIYGYDKIPSHLPNAQGYKIGLTERQQFDRRARQTMQALSFNQVIGYNLVSAEALNVLQLEERAAVELDFPMSEDHRYMRTNLLTTDLDITRYNVARNIKNVAIYESGRISYWEDGQAVEENHLAAVWTGNRIDQSWQGQDQAVDFFAMKGIVEALLASMNLACSIRYQAAHDIADTHPGRTARILADLGEKETVLGFIGQLHPQTADSYDLAQATYVFELSLDRLFDLPKQRIVQESIPKFPGIKRDIALLVDESVSHAEIQACIQEAGNKYLRDIQVFDLYTGDKIEAGKKSLAYQLSYLNPEATLQDDEVTANVDAIIQALSQELGAQVR
ncbi:phenylalanine--tRNA ligase subunit beta [Aerococcus sanguinicola]|uniref:phenylalanine--tRNA ligase subunit beta n=1 Tax=unclassified Aerococcus TaxID=2618060 RepID=UPI0008A144DB|nr:MULTISPECIES: phenylalanine--tRNA ligase subunit beta [unclassified Aerococcus]MDK6232829.1 phenylalanine--tRNA ligase subunit beta [Aerococcus sp. UMB10185]MDK6854880.1 phenylalanine--tRNA ligase subunit beta [Aerococcus sp. UMB7533]OFN02585.1 phenylalanine--tRNA ligase subunit beta [Aerococcus sp. HMSC062A02]OHO45435.1 phenylalanine--tRNA ligase subunit beta [Aerococcus sp. HMSC035B07]